MKKRDKFISFLLIIVIITLMAIIGICGYVMYNQIIGNEDIKLSFGIGDGDLDNTLSSSENTNIEVDNVIYSGVDTKEDTKVEYTGHLYNQLDETAKTIYDKLYENKENLKTGTYKVEYGKAFSKLLSEENGEETLKEEYQSAIEAFLYENPDVFYLDATKMYINLEKITRFTGVKYNVYINQGKNINYLLDEFASKEDIDKCEQQIKEIENQIILEAQGKTDYEKIKIVHDYLVDNTKYETTVSKSHIYDIYGTLVLKESVCEGYAKSFQYLMNKLDIDNVIVIGIATNSDNATENHAWNYVKLNEEWYAVDTTWDDPVVIGGGKASKKSRYQYFLKGSRTMDKNHTPSGNFTEGGQLFTYPTLSISDYK